MPIKHAAAKALKKSKTNHLYNLSWKEKIKKSIQKIEKFITEKNIKEAQKELNNTYKLLDKAVKGKVIKKNTADRKKSRVTNLINKNLKK